MSRITCRLLCLFATAVATTTAPLAQTRGQNDKAATDAVMSTTKSGSQE